jgi:FtsZ-interacting cell division protein ZipA
MPIWGWILIVGAVAIVAVLLVLASSANRRKKTDRLKDRFGPEYERVVSGTGEQKAAEKELVARERKREKLDIRPLTAASLDGYVARWRAVQTAFVDHPASAVGEADVLVTEVMRERGYPVDDDFEQQAADISVDHPTVVENYRAAHQINLSQQKGDVGTEQQRQAFVHFRALFDKLLETDKDTTKSQEASA